MIAKQSHEIAELKNIVKDLTSKIDQLSTPPSNQTTLGSSDATPTSVLASDNSNDQQEQQTQFVQRQYPPVILIVPPSCDPPNEMDRRYNVVVYGVEESSSNVSRISRSQSELEKIVSVLPNVNPTSIKDFHCLGKFKKTQERPRPIIVKFLRTLDAAAVLSNLDKISSPVSVKPDMSPELRLIEGKLLKERYSLIQQGISRRSIKIRNPCL